MIVIRQYCQYQWMFRALICKPPAESVVAPAERKQDFRGPMWLDDIDPELEVTPLLNGWPCSTLHDGDGYVAPSDCTGDSGITSGGGMRSLHVQRRLLPGDASESREAKLD